MALTNADIAELLARRGDETEGHRRRAYQRAASAALTWPEEARDVAEQGRPLTELFAVGDRLAVRIEKWIEEDELDDAGTADVRRDFLTLPQVRRVLAQQPQWQGARGDLQMHTIYSDGKSTVSEMALAGSRRGYEYVAITDHSAGLRVVKGMDEERIAQQRAEIDRVNGDLAGDGQKLRVLRAVEMNLDVEGVGDVEPAALVPLDLVLGSFHSQLRVKEDQTVRYVRALRNDWVDILAHPRGRKFNRRVGLVADWDAVLQEAALQDKALEINSSPDRQDLNVEILERASKGNLFSIATDAHNQQELSYFEYGLAAAAKAGVDRSRILNFWSREEVVAWARSHRD
jgi:histidinol phosphatase-like PHP family hydrolase